MNREPLAKPKGLSLKQHTENVLNEASQLLEAHPFVVYKYNQITGKNFEIRVKSAAKYHDEGKKHPKWQEACQKEYDLYKQTGKVKGSFLRKTGIRHEMESLYLHRNHNFSDVLKIAIASHHGKLSEKSVERWEKDGNGKYRRIWEDFKKLSCKIIFSDLKQDAKLEQAILQNYEFAGVRNYLQLADHRASITEDNNQVPSFTKFDYTFNNEWAKRPVQQIAQDNWEDNLLLLRAPTGAGKTDACLLWAKKQIENNRADRLVIAMPTRFTSNALSINVSSSLSETGLYHSSAWFVNFFNEAKNDPMKEHFFKLQHEFARLLETPITVCTIDHLLLSLTKSKEDHHSITFNLANSCLVIDEADFYDEFTQANIIELLKVLKILNVPVLLMSASLPESFLELYQKTGYDVKEVKEDTSDNQRIRCEIKEIRNYECTEDITDIIEKAQKEPSILYANTIDKAMEFYEAFPEEQRENITLYHSRFTEPDKAKKENELLSKLGKEAWKKGEAKGIVIMTQIGEMSVNISANYMVSEICPIDRLVQRIGRLSRFDDFVGILDVLIPHKKNEIYPAPYGSFTRGQGWATHKALKDTIEILKVGKYNAFDFVKMVNQVYAQLQDFSNKTQINTDALRQQIIQNWLILPNAQVEEGEESTHIWKSRDISSQSEVFVLNPYAYLDDNEQKLSKIGKHKNKGCFFDNYKEFMFYRNQYSVTCPFYLINNDQKQEKENQRIYYSDNIWIGDNTTPIKIRPTDYYDSNLGLQLVKKNEKLDNSML